MFARLKRAFSALVIWSIGFLGRCPRLQLNSAVGAQSTRNCGVNLFEDIAHPVAKFPFRIMRLELSHVTDPPDVVADAIGFLVAPVQFFAADLLAHFDGFEHGTVAVAATPDVVDLASARGADEFGKRFDQIEAMNVVADLFSFVPKTRYGRLLTAQIIK